MLARREHSAWELQRKLVAKGYALPLIEAVVEDLRGKNLQDDRRFAESYIRSRVERGFGPCRITSELKMRGVSDALIAACLKEEIEDWICRAAEARRKRFGPAFPGSLKERARQVRFLQYRGFTHEQVSGVLSGADD